MLDKLPSALASLILYTAPAVYAVARSDRRHVPWIVMIALLTGWTGVGYVAAWIYAIATRIPSTDQ